MLESFTHATFAEHVGTTFRVHVNDAEGLDVALAEVEKLPTPEPRRPTSTLRREAFALLFHGPRQPWFPQGMYRVEHPALGKFSLFLVPLGPADDAMRYEAVFT